jgi:hypothetical protein
MSTAIKFYFLKGAAAFNPHLNCLAPLAMTFTLQSVQPRIILPGVSSVTVRINVE